MRGIRQLKRQTGGTQDDAKAAEYRSQLRTAQKKLKAFVDENDDALRWDYWRERYIPIRLVKLFHWKMFLHLPWKRI